MRALILYHPNGDNAGLVEEYAHDFKRFKGKQLELVSVDSKSGWATAGLYGITAYPAIIVLASDGSVIDLWQGLPLPLMDEVSSHLPDYDRDLAAAQLLAV